MTSKAVVPVNRRTAIDGGGRSMLLSARWSGLRPSLRGIKGTDKSVYKYIYARFVLRVLNRRRG